MKLKKEREVWIVFGDTKSCLKHVFKKGFQHCFLITKDETGWYALMPNNSELFIRRIKFPLGSNYISCIKHRYNIFHVTFVGKERRLPNLWPKMPINCVSVCAYTIGLNKVFFSPYRLWKFLKKISVGKTEREWIKSATIVR